MYTFVDILIISMRMSSVVIWKKPCGYWPNQLCIVCECVCVELKAEHFVALYMD